MDYINWSLFIFITLITFIIFLIFYFREKRHNRRLLYVFVVLTVYLYSGIGQSFTDISSKYIYKYFIFLFVLLMTISVTFNFYKENRYLDENKNKIDIALFKYKTLYLICSIGFLATLFIYLLYPTIRIHQLWNPPSPSIINIFVRRDLYESIFVLKIADTIHLLLFPFFLLHLYILICNRRKFTTLIWILSWLYLDYLTFGYWGRYEIILNLIFTFLALTSINKNGFKFKRSTLYLMLIIIMILIPFLLSYEMIRLGKTANATNFIDSFIKLFRKETSYPRYYTTIIDYNYSMSPLTYLYWLIILPIPSIIWRTKPSISVNSLFTTYHTGLQKGMAGYSVVLPSILGESFMIWGEHFYWIHAILIGVIVSLFCVLYEKSKFLSLINLYFIVHILVLGRGGSQSHIALLINISISIIIWLFIIKKSLNPKQKFMDTI